MSKHRLPNIYALPRQEGRLKKQQQIIVDNYLFFRARSW